MSFKMQTFLLTPNEMKNELIKLFHFAQQIIYRQQAKLFEEKMASVFGGVDGAPSGEQLNLTFQKMAGEFLLHIVHTHC